MRRAELLLLLLRSLLPASAPGALELMAETDSPLARVPVGTSAEAPLRYCCTCWLERPEFDRMPFAKALCIASSRPPELCARWLDELCCGALLLLPSESALESPEPACAPVRPLPPWSEPSGSSATSAPVLEGAALNAPKAALPEFALLGPALSELALLEPVPLADEEWW